MNGKLTKTIGTIVIIMGLITGIFTIDSRYARLSALEKVEQQTVLSLEQFKKSLDARYLSDRYTELIDQKMNLKIMLIKHPGDTDVKELLEQVDGAVKDVKIKIDKLNSE